MKKIGNINDIVYLKSALKIAIDFKNRWEQRKLTKDEKQYGLCWNIALTGFNGDVLDYINKHYVGFSGHCLYPVAHPTYIPSVAYCLYKGDLYDRRTEYGRNRYQFLLTVIEVLSELICLTEESTPCE